MLNFQKLLVCRDAYLKIIGKQMGLDKPWEPDWSDLKQIKYSITTNKGDIVKKEVTTSNKILVFPTEEMQNTFYCNNNLMELIKKM